MIAVYLLIMLRMLFWTIFPQFGMGINSELIFMCISINVLACYFAFKTPLRLPILWLLLATIASFFIAHDKTKAVSFMLSQGLYIIMFSVICSGKRKDLLFVFMCAMALVAGKAIYEIPIIARSHSFIGWPTATASVLLLGIPISFKLCRPFLAAVLIAGLLATKSIMPIVSLMIIIGIMYYKRWYVVLCGVAAVAGIIFFRGGITSTIDVRMGYLTAVIEKIVQHPVKGSGIGSFLIEGPSQTIYAHNSYLQIWAETGIVGFLAICAMVYKIVQARPRTALETGVYFGILAFLIDNVTNFTLLRFSTSIYFWVILGCYFSMRKEYDNARDHSRLE